MSAVDITFRAFTVAAALIGSVAAVISARRARHARYYGQQINDAVNHRHQGQPRIFDVVKTLEEMTRHNTRRLDGLQDRLTQHDAWERGIADGLGADRWSDSKRAGHERRGGGDRRQRDHGHDPERRKGGDRRDADISDM